MKNNKNYVSLFNYVNLLEIRTARSIDNKNIVNSILRSTRSIKKQLENFFLTLD